MTLAHPEPAEPPKARRARGERAAKPPAGFRPTELEAAALRQVLDELERLRSVAGWPKRSFRVCETHCTGLLWCLRNGVTLVMALDAVRAMCWVHANGPEKVAGGGMAEPTTIFGERTQGDERRLRMGRQVDRWIAAGRPEPRPAASERPRAPSGVVASGFRRKAVVTG